MSDNTGIEKSNKRSEIMKKLWADGVFSRKRPESFKNKISEKIKKRKEIGLPVTPNQFYNETKDPKLKHVAKGIDHHRSKFWILESPTGLQIEGFNLSEIVRTNKHLFDPDDVLPYESNKDSCRAVSSISALKQLKKDGSIRRYSWKGWKLILIKDVSTGIIEFQSKNIKR